jgi:hypothetical protein
MTMTNHAKLLSEAFAALDKHNNKLDLHHVEKQLIKYTKGHFNRMEFNDLDDLKYFASKLYYIGLDQIDNRNVYHMVVNLYQELIDAGYITFKLENFLNTMFKRAWFDNDRKEISYNDVIKHILIEFQLLQIKGWDGHLPDIELGENDETIFTEVLT